MPDTTQDPVLQLDPRQPGAVISPLLFGHNLEHTRRAMWQGLSAQLLLNRKFAGPVSVRSAEGKPAGVRGELSPDGLCAGWQRLGAAAVRYEHEASDGYAGKESQKLVLPEGAQGGLAQGGLPLKGGAAYEFRAYVLSEVEVKASVRFTDASGQTEHARHTATLQSEDWEELSFRFTLPQTDQAARLEISFEGPATLWVGAVSLLPVDHFHGLRRDVLECLREISVPMLRWPGGNFVLDYRWKEGLLPVDQRPPIAVGLADTQPFTHNSDAHEIGIDEFIAVCRFLGAEPFITANCGPKELTTAQEAADWIEYCNGGPGTKWGAERAKRGHAAPYRVKYWSIGNEVWGVHMLDAHCEAQEYARRVAEYAPVMKKADPSIILTAVGLPAPVWDGIVSAEAGQHFDYLSGHYYLKYDEKLSDNYRTLALAPSTKVRTVLENCRAVVDKNSPAGKSIPTAYDEWNVWHDWFVAPHANPWNIGPGDGAHVAGVLSLLCRDFVRLNISIAAYFQPVNEGAVAVEPFSTQLTSVGQAHKMFRAHHGQRQAGLTGLSEYVDGCASMSSDGAKLCVTLVSLDAGRDLPVTLELPPEIHAKSTSAQIYFAQDLKPNLPLQEKNAALEPNGNKIACTLPRYGFILVTLLLK